MDKRLDELKKRVIGLNLERLEPEEIKARCNYQNTYALLTDFIHIIENGFNSMNIYSKRGQHRYLIKVVEATNLLINIYPLSSSDPLCSKLQNLARKSATILTRNNKNQEFNNLVLKLNKEINRIERKIEHVPADKYVNIDAYLADIDEQQEDEEIIKYIIFELKDFSKLTELLKKYPMFKIVINDNLEEISMKVTNEYLKALLGCNREDSTYFYMVFMMLTSKDYRFKKAADKIINRLNVALDTLNNILIDPTTKKLFTDDINHLIASCYNDFNNLEEKYELNLVYNQDMLEELTKLDVKEHDLILDLRDRYIFTIDALNTECYDDAVSIDVLPNGNYIVGVYIADVDAYVKPGSALDKFAYHLGASVYMNDVITMLPKELSSDKVSLNKNGIKQVHAYMYEITPSFDIVDIKFNNAIIEVKDRYTYTEVDDLINNGGSKKKLEKFLKLYEFSEYLNKNNPMREKYIKSKEKKKPEKKEMEQYKQGYATNIISELKVLTNSVLASRAFQAGSPFIYRINQRKEDQIPEEIIKMIQGKESYDRLIGPLTSEFGDSYYSADNKGHYGLGVSSYAHATTPLRNYSSLFNQRIIQKLLIDDNLTDKDVYSLEVLTPLVATHLNKRIMLNDEFRNELSSQNPKVLTKKIEVIK